MATISVAGDTSTSFKRPSSFGTGTANPINDNYLTVRIYHTQNRTSDLYRDNPYWYDALLSSGLDCVDSPNVIVTEGKKELALSHLPGVSNIQNVRILPRSPFSTSEMVKNSLGIDDFLTAANRNYLGLDVAIGDIEDLLDSLPWSDEVREFALGFGGKKPIDSAIRMANRVYRAATKFAVEYDFYVDDSDGALGIMLRLRNGLLLLAELSVGGTLSGGTYDDEEGTQMQFLPNATVEQMISLL